MKRPRIVWNRITTERPRAISLTAENAFIPSLSGSSLASEALLIAGIPSVEGAASPREDAIGLLMLASEVEHALMVQYLYAAQSLRGTAARIVAHIAVQEMGHLITLQNLLLAITGTTDEDLPALIHLGRDNLRRSSDRNPIPFVLDHVTHVTLAKFVVVERPHEIADVNLLRRVEALEREAADAGLQPHPVSALYAAIRWLFQPSDLAVSELDLSTDLGMRSGWHLTEQDFVKAEIIDKFASTITEWHSIPGMIVASVHNHSEALAAIDAITAQGEGILGSSDSHFSRFLELLDSFEAGTVRVRPLPRTPYVRGEELPEDPFPTEITNSYTRLWAQLFNLQYELLLCDIAWAISQPHASAARQAMIDITIDAMNNVVQPLSNDMTGHALDDIHPMKAGPPYGLANESIPSSINDFRARFDSLFTRQAALIAAIRLAPEFVSDAVGNIRLSDILQQNDVRAPYLPQGD